MLHEFLTDKRTELIARCRAKVATRVAPKVTPVELEHGIPQFLDQLIETLRAEQTRSPAKGPAREVTTSAKKHGRQLMLQGYTIDQVVHDYGDLCQAITGLASELGETMAIGEFQTLNRCLDDAIAGAVTEFSAGKDTLAASQPDDRTRILHELLTHVETAALAIGAVKAGNVGLKGSTGAVLDLSLSCMRTLIEEALAGRSVPDASLARH